MACPMARQQPRRRVFWCQPTRHHSRRIVARIRHELIQSGSMTSERLARIFDISGRWIHAQHSLDWWQMPVWGMNCNGYGGCNHPSTVLSHQVVCCSWTSCAKTQNEEINSPLSGSKLDQVENNTELLNVSKTSRNIYLCVCRRIYILLFLPMALMVC